MKVLQQSMLKCDALGCGYTKEMPLTLENIDEAHNSECPNCGNNLLDDAGAHAAIGLLMFFQNAQEAYDRLPEDKKKEIEDKIEKGEGATAKVSTKDFSHIFKSDDES